MSAAVEFTEHYFRGKNSHKLHYRVHTSKNAKVLLVCLHGYGGNASAWDELLAFLENGNTDFLSIDLPEHGLSERVSDVAELKLTDLLEDIRSIISETKKGNQDVVLAGHCFGGILGMLAAETYPSLFKHLILINSGYTLPPILTPLNNRPARTFLYRIAGALPGWHMKGMTSYVKFKNTSDYSIPRLLTDIASVGPKYYFQLGSLITELDLVESIKKITIPVYVVISEKDRVFSPSYSRRFASFFKNHQLIVLPNLNHISILNNPLQVATSIREFVHS